MTASGKRQGRAFGAAITVALLALAPAVQAASTSRTSCVKITSAVLSSSCVPGANIKSFAFSMEGTVGASAAAAAYDALETEGTAPGANIATTIPARAGESIVPCRATDVTVTVGFTAPIISVSYPGGATVSGASMVTFFAETLESHPTEFAVVLDTTGIAITDANNAVTYVSYSDNEGNSPDMAGLMSVAAAAASAEMECDEDVVVATDVGRWRMLRRTGGKHDDDYDECGVCSILSSAQLEALAIYDNGGKKIVCDPTCLDGVSDPTHCNYFGLGQICRGCGECSTCSACPSTDETRAPTRNPTEPPFSLPTPSPTAAPAADSTRPPLTRADNDDVSAGYGDSFDNDDDIFSTGVFSSGVATDDYFSTGAYRFSADDDASTGSGATTGYDVSTDDDGVITGDYGSRDYGVNTDDGVNAGAGDSNDDAGDFDCSLCTDLSDDQLEALATYDRGGKKIVCDPTCLDGVSDPTHCNYFGLGQICRGCGTCTACTPCP